MGVLFCMLFVFEVYGCYALWKGVVIGDDFFANTLFDWLRCPAFLLQLSGDWSAQAPLLGGISSPQVTALMLLLSLHLYSLIILFAE